MALYKLEKGIDYKKQLIFGLTLNKFHQCNLYSFSTYARDIITEYITFHNDFSKEIDDFINLMCTPVKDQSLIIICYEIIGKIYPYMNDSHINTILNICTNTLIESSYSHNSYNSPKRLLDYLYATLIKTKYNISDEHMLFYITYYNNNHLAYQLFDKTINFDFINYKFGPKSFKMFLIAYGKVLYDYDKRFILDHKVFEKLLLNNIKYLANCIAEIISCMTYANYDMVAIIAFLRYNNLIISESDLIKLLQLSFNDETKLYYNHVMKIIKFEDLINILQYFKEQDGILNNNILSSCLTSMDHYIFEDIFHLKDLFSLIDYFLSNNIKLTIDNLKVIKIMSKLIFELDVKYSIIDKPDLELTIMSCKQDSTLLFNHLYQKNFIVPSIEVLTIACINGNMEIIDKLLELRIQPTVEMVDKILINYFSRHINDLEELLKKLMMFGLKINNETAERIFAEYSDIDMSIFSDNVDNDKLLLKTYINNPINTSIFCPDINPSKFENIDHIKFRKIFSVKTKKLEDIQNWISKNKYLPDQYCFDMVCFANRKYDTTIEIINWLNSEFKLKPTMLTIQNLFSFQINRAQRSHAEALSFIGKYLIKTYMSNNDYSDVYKLTDNNKLKSNKSKQTKDDIQIIT
jgi:hypothetical protein